MTRMWSKLKWRIAEFLNKHTEMCWAQLVGWVLYGETKFFDGNNDFSSKSCQRDRDETGSCYCGKYKDGVTHDELPEAK